MKKENRLEDMNKVKAPFVVPQDYFETLERSIGEKVATSAPGFAWPKWRLAVIPALAVVAISSVFIILHLGQTNDSADDLLAGISNEEILTYLEYSNLSEYEIASLADQPESLVPDDVNYLEKLDLGEEDLDDLANEFGLDNEYL